MVQQKQAIPIHGDRFLTAKGGGFCLDAYIQLPFPADHDVEIGG